MAGRPILVTGSHRSGTTWTGAMLGLSREALPIHEPFNPGYERSWLATPPEHWFQRVPGNMDTSAVARWQHELEAVIDLRPPIAAIARRSIRPRHLIRLGQEVAASRQARSRGARPLLKDPIAFFSADWLQRAFDAHVLVLVRHPAAFASSLKRLNWRFDFANFADQPTVMEMLPDDQADAVCSAVDTKLDIIDTAILIWRVINGVARRYEAEPGFVLQRYEDLASNPERSFESLYAQFGLTWTPDVARAVRSTSSEGNTSDVADGDKGGITRDSHAAMWTWLDRLSDIEANRIREGTADIAEHFYDDSDWEPPAE